MACVACGRGFHAECRNSKGCKKCHPKSKNNLMGLTNEEVITTRKKGSTAEALRDPLSTGRKRAAELYRVDKEAPCEWQGKSNCGGGRRPIVGCLDGRQRDLHHGPVKNTTRNYEGNVHRICKSCHNHWHELNDLIYDEKDYSKLPHDPMDATVEELTANQLAWITGEIGRRYELASSRNRKKKLIITD